MDGEWSWEPHLDQAQGSERQHDQVQWKQGWAKEKRESRPRCKGLPPLQTEVIEWDTCVHRVLSDQFLQRCLQHPKSTCWCCRMVLLSPLILFPRQSLVLRSSGPGNSHLRCFWNQWVWRPASEMWILRCQVERLWLGGPKGHVIAHGCSVQATPPAGPGAQEDRGPTDGGLGLRRVLSKSYYLS